MSLLPLLSNKSETALTSEPLFCSINKIQTRQERCAAIKAAQDYDIYYNDTKLVETWKFYKAPDNLDRSMPDYN